MSIGETFKALVTFDQRPALTTRSFNRVWKLEVENFSQIPCVVEVIKSGNLANPDTNPSASNASSLMEPLSQYLATKYRDVDVTANKGNVGMNTRELAGAIIGRVVQRRLPGSNAFRFKTKGE